VIFISAQLLLVNRHDVQQQENKKTASMTASAVQVSGFPISGKESLIYTERVGYGKT